MKKTFLVKLVCVCILSLFLRLYCTSVLTKQSAGVSECSDLGVRQAGEQGQQGRKEVLIINEAIPTGVHQNPSKFAQAGFETLQQGAWSAQRVVHWLLEEERERKKKQETDLTSYTAPSRDIRNRSLWMARLMTITSVAKQSD